MRLSSLLILVCIISLSVGPVSSHARNHQAGGCPQTTCGKDECGTDCGHMAAGKTCPAGACDVSEAKAQTNCPVMGGKINKDIYSDYEGKRVYFCCQGCEGPFSKQPATYIEKLEQEGVTLAKADKEAREEKAHISTPVLKSLLDAKVSLVLLDARSGDLEAMIPGAKRLTAAATAEDAKKLIPSKKSLVVTYCAHIKCPASKHLADRLKALGYENVLEYPEGIEGWIEAEHETTRKA